jgi:phosphotransferase system enzyme I (PtsI)
VIHLRGLAASPGVAIAHALQFRLATLVCERCTVPDPSAEWSRFEEALALAREQLQSVIARTQAESSVAHASIFEAQMMMLADPELLGTVRAAVQTERLNAESALLDAARGYAQMLEALEDEYLRARAADVRDVTDRVLRILLGISESLLPQMTGLCVVLARDLTPSDTVMLDKSLVLGFCTATGGETGHTAILARGLGLPAVVGAGPAVLDVPDGTTVVLDGTCGQLIVDPDEATILAYGSQRAGTPTHLSEARTRAAEPAVTRDGRRVAVSANIGSVEGARAALEAGADGVGLLRTEFLYLERGQFPGEEEQYLAYRAITDAFGARPVILRTFDIGGDKDLPYMALPREENPFLGMRAIRLCLARPELLRPQLRAALRAAVGRNLKLMFPMVATLGEIRAARRILEGCRAELAAAGQCLPAQVEVGIMVEVPAAALMADRLAAEVDFFSIGTNDLSQYVMAADRTNTSVSALASAFQPAVLRLVRDVIEAAHRQGKWVEVCGELASEPLAIPILLGLGLDEFSMNAAAIPLVKQIIRTLTVAETKALAPEALALDTPEEVQALVRERVPVTDDGCSERQTSPPWT